MPTRIEIYCASERALSYAEMIEAMDMYVPGTAIAAECDPPLTADSKADHAWSPFELRYHSDWRPIQVYRVSSPIEVAVHVQELLEELKSRSLDEPDEIAERLRCAQQIIMIELGLDAPDEIWEDLDATVMRLCHWLDGLVAGPDGIYDEDLRPLASWA